MFLYFVEGLLEEGEGLTDGLGSRLVLLDWTLEVDLEGFLELTLEAGLEVGASSLEGEDSLLCGWLRLLLGIRVGEDCDWLGSGELPG